MTCSCVLCPTPAATPDAASGEPVVLAIAQFPETNAFSRASSPPFYRISAQLNDTPTLPHPHAADVVNGERNAILVSIESKDTERNVTLKNIAGSLHNVQTNKLIKNVCRRLSFLLLACLPTIHIVQFTKTDYPIPLIEGAPLQLPYTFYSE